MLAIYRKIVRAAGLVLVCTTSTFAAGQGGVHTGTELTPVGNVTRGDGTTEGSFYYDMNWYRTIKLGTAPFFNAELARKAEVAYRFDAGTISAIVDSANLSDLYMSSKLVLAGMKDDEIFVPIWPGAGDKSIEDATKELVEEGYIAVYLGKDKQFSGDHNVVGKAVVSWEPMPWRRDIGTKAPPPGEG